VEQGLYLLAGMAEADLRAAIEEPARLASLVVEPGLMDLLVNEVAGPARCAAADVARAGETWQRREGRTLTSRATTPRVGFRGAVAQSAEAVYERIPPQRRTVLRDLLLRLIPPARTASRSAAGVPRRLVVTGPDNEAMIDLLVGARLVTSDDGIVELAHESLRPQLGHGCAAGWMTTWRASGSSIT
jgi:hypothetical protein